MWSVPNKDSQRTAQNEFIWTNHPNCLTSIESESFVRKLYFGRSGPHWVAPRLATRYIPCVQLFRLSQEINASSDVSSYMRRRTAAILALVLMHQIRRLGYWMSVECIRNLITPRTTETRMAYSRLEVDLVHLPFGSHAHAGHVKTSRASIGTIWRRHDLTCIYMWLELERVETTKYFRMLRE